MFEKVESLSFFLFNLQSSSTSRSRDTKPKDSIPLAEKMRPNSIMSYVGQKHVLGPESMLYQLLSKTEIPNIILWGPPGCGKVRTFIISLYLGLRTLQINFKLFTVSDITGKCHSKHVPTVSWREISLCKTLCSYVRYQRCQRCNHYSF